MGVLGGLLGGGGAQGGGGLGGLLGGGAPAGGGGGSLLGSILKQAAGGGGAQGGGAGGLLGSILGAAAGAGAAAPEPAPIPQQQAHDQATILVRAMCNAAKADGQVDEQEQKNIVDRMGELDQAEVDFLRKELSSPLDVQGFVNQVPREMGPQVYALSCMTMKVDTRAEAQYLGQLAQGLGLDDNVTGQIHQQLGLV